MGSNVKTSKELMTDWRAEMELRMKNPEKFRGFYLGIPDLDAILGGGVGGAVHMGWYILIAAKRKVGKTAALTTISEALGKQKVKFGRFSYEEGLYQIAERAISHRASIDRSKLTNINMTEEEWTNARAASFDIEHYDAIWATSDPTVAGVRKIALETGLQVILVDYVQLMSDTSNSANRVQEIGAISRGLKALTMIPDHPMAVIAAAQLNDEGDYLWSRDLGRDCDVGVKLEQILDPSGIVVDSRIRALIADSRHSGLADFDLAFNGAQSRIAGLDEVRKDINDVVNERLGKSK